MAGSADGSVTGWLVIGSISANGPPFGRLGSRSAEHVSRLCDHANYSPHTRCVQTTNVSFTPQTYQFVHELGLVLRLELGQDERHPVRLLLRDEGVS